MTHFADLLDEGGRIKVNSHFQVEGHENVFALGDCCNMEAKMAYYAAKHGSVVAQNIITLQLNTSRAKPKALSSYKREYFDIFFCL